MAIETVNIPEGGLNLTTTRTPKSELGKDDFLKLLTQQLKNQDPMNPMNDMEFINQMSSFSSLEQMVNMNKSLDSFIKTFSTNSHTQAMMFLGTTVTAQTAEMEEPVTGVVEMVGFKDGKPFLKVGDQAFDLENVQLVSPTVYSA
ncbi:MAG TPA: flagellar hook capping FlgD N-terminal domain-containing protein [Candidatus Rifleibacterium sp.]|jgi:flagellar basal-body rod modification protein FlgD|nr:flagellar hook capping FlgD N-terminal domain-containing protein [Candidatus Rifleibacterium sp.]HPW58861.1 flagellar hook capping FlgD N-terminal domain-containing protein [Candidatus Rifleibacterium sp.]